MKMSDAQIVKLLHQLEAETIPREHPLMSHLERLYGDHTYFVAGNGLNIVEPVDADGPTARGVVMNLASWTDATEEYLRPHLPEATEVFVDIAPNRRH